MESLRLPYSQNTAPLKVVYRALDVIEKSGEGGYRYAFNGMEKDDEVKGSGNSYTTEFRQYDSRLGCKTHDIFIINTPIYRNAI